MDGRPRGARPMNGRTTPHPDDFVFPGGRNNRWAYGPPPPPMSPGYFGNPGWGGNFGHPFLARPRQGPRQAWYPGDSRGDRERFSSPVDDTTFGAPFNEKTFNTAFRKPDAHSLMLHGVQDFKVALERATATLVQLRDDFNTKYDNLENFTDNGKSGIWREALGKRNGLKLLSKVENTRQADYRPAYELQSTASTLRQSLDEVTTIETFVSDPVVRGEREGVSEVYRTIWRNAADVVTSVTQARESFRALNMAISMAKHLQDYLEDRRTLWETQEELREREEMRKAVEDHDKKRQQNDKEGKGQGEHGQDANGGYSDGQGFSQDAQGDAHGQDGQY